MMDISAIGTALSSLKILYDLAKNANDASLATKISTAVADLQGRLLDVQIQSQGLLEENIRLKEQVSELQAALKKKQEMKFAKGAYYTVDSGPFCQHCWEGDQKAVRLSRVMPSPGAEPVTDPDAIVVYSCVYHTAVRVAWPLGPAKFIEKLNSES